MQDEGGGGRAERREERGADMHSMRSFECVLEPLVLLSLMHASVWSVPLDSGRRACGRENAGGNMERPGKGCGCVERLRACCWSSCSLYMDIAYCMTYLSHRVLFTQGDKTEWSEGDGRHKRDLLVMSVGRRYTGFSLERRKRMTIRTAHNIRLNGHVVLSRPISHPSSTRISRFVLAAACGGQYLGGGLKKKSCYHSPGFVHEHWA